MNEAEIHIPLVKKGFKGRSETEKVWMLSRFLGVTYTLFADSLRFQHPLAEGEATKSLPGMNWKKKEKKRGMILKTVFRPRP